MCSFVVANIHPPTKITGCVSLPDDICVLSRGNELIVARRDDSGLVFEKKYTLFGNIVALSSFQNNVFVLLSSEIFLHFEYEESTMYCRSKCSCAQIGVKVPRFLLSSSSTFTAVHTRVRTLFLINGYKCFPVMVPVSEIYHIRCFDDRFMVFGKSFKQTFNMMLFIVDWETCTVNKVKDEKLFSKVGETHSVYVNEDGSFAVCVDQTLKLYDAAHEFQTELEAKAPYTCLYSHRGRLIGFDSEGMIDTDSQQRILRLNRTESIVEIADDFCVHLSSHGDAHVLKFGDSTVRVYETYGQLNAVEFMGRSQFITRDGKLRSIVNGFSASVEASLSIHDGVNMWFVDGCIFVSTYDKTVCLDQEFNVIESPASVAEQSFLVAKSGDFLIHVTAGGVYVDGFCHYEADAEISHAIARDEYIAIAQANRRVLVFEVADASIVQVAEINTEVDVSALAMSKDVISLALWNSPVIRSYALRDGHETDTYSVDCDFISSLIYSDNDDFIVGGCGEVIIDGKKIRVGHENVKLRLISGRVFVISDVCGLLDGDEIKSFDVVRSALDIIPYGERSMAVLTPESIIITTIDSEYPAHIEDYYIASHSISLWAVDESNHCPLVFAAKKDNNVYSLISQALPTVKLNPTTTPKVLLWIDYHGEKLLLVGCQEGSNGKLLVYDIRLQPVAHSTVTLPAPVDAMTFVNGEYIAVAVSNSLLLLKFEEDMKITVADRSETRCACASLTSPNSCAIVYADKCASVIVYTAIDGKLAVISRDFNPKRLKFARLESETDIIAIGEDGSLYHLRMDSPDKLTTVAAFNVAASCCAVLNAPDLVFVTESGALCGVFKASSELKAIFDVMKARITGMGNLSITDYRFVTRNNKTYDLGNFIDWDFIETFKKLDPKEKGALSRIAGVDVAAIEKCISDFADRLASYREASQYRLIL